jgi:hypothetical protein
MKNVAIMADNADNFVKPRAEGLARMLSRIGIRSKVFYDGLHFLDLKPAAPTIDFSGPGSLVRSVLRKINPPGEAFLKARWKELESFDLMVVVETVPTAYLNYHLNRVEEVRERFPKMPIVLYSSIYLSTLGEWIGFLKKGKDYHGFIKGSGHFGLERYDWYLIGSATTDFPLPKGFQPLSVIGCDLDDGSLFPEQNSSFHALLDFERPNHMPERAVQIMALEKTKTPYTVLHGRYPMAEIRKIYRKTSIYFLAHLEAFGLPIVEVQACGGKVYTPYARWAWAHYQKPDLTLAGEGPLSENFVVYKNDLEELCQQIESDKAAFDPARNRDLFLKTDGRFFHGDMAVLQAFADGVRNGTIHSKLHKDHAPLNDLIVESL